MKYLIIGMESKAKIDCLLMATKIDSARKIEALHHHFVGGMGISAAAAMAELQQSKLTNAIEVLNKFAGICENFHEIKLREAK